ncbi:MAG: glycosyltransferase, partial [Paludibacteraceae bacterium]|nr:glycosyltransferase [Paludibacteraceae bacterium]
MKILYLTAWYPHRYDAMTGLFVRKHAAAVAQHAQVVVLYVHADERISRTEIVEQQTDGVQELYVYYPRRSSRWSKGSAYLKAVRAGWRETKRRHGRPDVCHVNVLTRAGLLALYLKQRHHIPYIITEHWSRYLPQNFSYTGRLRRYVTEQIVRRASAVLTVSKQLARAMQQEGLHNTRYELVNNVVDDGFYQIRPRETVSEKLILHVSCFDERAKNMQGMLRAIRQVRHSRQDFRLVIIGTGADYEATTRYAADLDILSYVCFLGEQTPESVCEMMHKADFFLLFSNYENAPVVLSEAMASGLPIVTSDAGGIPEMMHSRNGLMVRTGDESA